MSIENSRACFASVQQTRRTNLTASVGGIPGRSWTSESSAFVDHANRSNIVMNTIDARGLYTADLFGDS
jgi:hypothetical protein